MFHDEGASTDVTGTDVVVRASMITEKGSLTSPAKLNPSWVSVRSNVCVLFEHIPTENGINDMISVAESCVEFIREGNVQILQLRGQSLLKVNGQRFSISGLAQRTLYNSLLVCFG